MSWVGKQFVSVVLPDHTQFFYKWPFSNSFFCLGANDIEMMLQKLPKYVHFNEIKFSRALE